MAYSKELKNTVMEELNNGVSIKEISKKYNISMATIYNWKKSEITQSEEIAEQVVIEKQSDDMVDKKIKSLSIGKSLVPSKKHKVIKKKFKVKTKKTCIKDLFGPEILQLQKYMYVNLGSKASINAWDKLDILINKEVSDKEALQRLIKLLVYVDSRSEIPVTVDPKRIEKVQKRYL